MRRAGVASPLFDARALAQHLVGGPLLAIDELPTEQFHELIEQRAKRVPLQHLVGSVGFRYLDLLVGPGVFIPRPETELVAGAAVDAAGPRAVVVDLCSGSGAIALSVAHEVPGAVVHALELDPVALEWARRNDPDRRICWHEGPVEGCLTELDGTVDVVVSNPPYVPVGTVIDAETAQDPRLALWGGADGLDVTRQVEAAARRLLRRGGLVVVEHDVTQGHSAPAVFADWDDVVDHQDLTGRDRYLTARWTR